MRDLCWCQSMEHDKFTMLANIIIMLILILIMLYVMIEGPDEFDLVQVDEKYDADPEELYYPCTLR